MATALAHHDRVVAHSQAIFTANIHCPPQQPIYFTSNDSVKTNPVERAETDPYSVLISLYVTRTWHRDMGTASGLQ